MIYIGGGLKAVCLFIFALSFSSCSQSLDQKINDLIEIGEHQQARNLLSNEAPNGLQPEKIAVLMMMSFRKEFFPSYTEQNFRSPLEGIWVMFPAKEMTSIDSVLKIAQNAHAANFWNDDLAGEYYFLLLYSFYRYKYKSQAEYKDVFSDIVELLNAEKSTCSDLAAFWKIYANQGFTINFDWQILDSFFEKFPVSKLAKLKELKMLFKEKKEDPFFIDHNLLSDLHQFSLSYPDLAVYADSLFIYQNIADILNLSESPGFDKDQIENYLRSLLAENMSTAINRYILWELGKIELEKGNQTQALNSLKKIVDLEQDKYKRTKLNRELGHLAFRKTNFGLVISSLRQIDTLDPEDMQKLWIAYMELDNEIEADKIFEKLASKLPPKNIEILQKQKYNYQLKKLILSDLNLVWSPDAVTIQGSIKNISGNIYQKITILLSLEDKNSNTKINKEIMLDKLYPNKEDKFNTFINFQGNYKDTKITGKVINFKIAS
jgi:hypothetical protein